MNQIRHCYQRQLSRDPGLAGKVTVRFVIGNTGQVQKATVKSSSLGSAAVESCIAERFLRFRFPAPKGKGIVIVSYPFLFSPS
jgi:TonB family protein